MPIARDVLVLASALVSALAVVPAAPAAELDTGELAVVRAVNVVREQHGLTALRVDARLNQVARAYSRRLLRDDAFTHGDFARRVAASGAVGPYFGENLAWGTGSRATARGIVDAWLRSPVHRANLLRAGWVRLGIGRSVGDFRGVSEATVVAANFAGR